jgi:uncharacterized protein
VVNERDQVTGRVRLSRRQFLETIAGVVALGSQTLAMQQSGPAGLPVRPLGRTGASISIVGLGGWDSVAGGMSDTEAITLMHEALDLGITFWDNAWEYHNGRAEEVMGRAFDSPSRRDRVFLMTKVCARDYEGARRQIEESMRRLRTDRIDLLQFHSVQYEGDPQRIFDPEKGARRAVLEAQKAGKVRFVGFSGHMHPDTHLDMLGRTDAWDAVQMPVNILDAHYLSFEKRVLPVCQQKGFGVLGMKSLAAQNGRLPRELNVSAELCRRYALSLPIASLVCGMQNREQVRMMATIARDFTPLTRAQADELLATSRGPAKGGAIERYKDMTSGYGCSYHARMLKEGAAAAGD